MLTSARLAAAVALGDRIARSREIWMLTRRVVRPVRESTVRDPPWRPMLRAGDSPRPVPRPTSLVVRFRSRRAIGIPGPSSAISIAARLLSSLADDAGASFGALAVLVLMGMAIESLRA
jgi:hypothetical protein